MNARSESSTVYPEDDTVFHKCAAAPLAAAAAAAAAADTDSFEADLGSERTHQRPGEMQCETVEEPFCPQSSTASLARAQPQPGIDGNVGHGHDLKSWSTRIGIE